MEEKQLFGIKLADLADKLGKTTSELVNEAGKKTSEVALKAQGEIKKSKENVKNTLDVNGDGNIDIEDIIVLGMRTPGIKINRKEFLQKELTKNYSKEVIDDAISYNPAHAKIPIEEIDGIADEVIKYERVCVSGISAVLGMPGGATMAATIPADITQYYGYMLRATQKMLYLYGFPEIDTNETGQTFDSETMNILVLCMGVMYGAAGANNAIKGISKALATGVEKQLVKQALTKGTIYPIVKNVSKWFGVKMTKDVFAGFFGKSIPLLGGVIGGSLTYVTFKPCCDKLKNSLRDTLLANPNEKNEDPIVDTIANDIASESELSEAIYNEVIDDGDPETSIENGELAEDKASMKGV